MDDYADELAGQRLIGPDELSKLIGRSVKCIQIDASRRPETLPPRFVIPGTRKVHWRVKDVIAWMEGLAQTAKESNAREQALHSAMRRPFFLGKR